VTKIAHPPGTDNEPILLYLHDIPSFFISPHLIFITHPHRLRPAHNTSISLPACGLQNRHEIGTAIALLLGEVKKRKSTERNIKKPTRCMMKANLMLVLTGVVYAFFAMNVLVTNNAALTTVINNL